MNVSVIGGGIAGLVAACEAAERGAQVTLHEATPVLGGRAVASRLGYRTNLGPHVLYQQGALGRWLAARSLTPPLVPLHLHRTVWITNGRTTRRTRPALLGALRRVRTTAPIDESFRSWGSRHLGAATTEQLARLAGLFTYHHDPGELSAQFIWDRVRSDFVHPWNARTVVGGWEQLVSSLEGHARQRGVRIELGARVRPADLNDGPTIVATSLAVASRLLDDRSLTWFGSRTALLDIAVSGQPSRGHVLGIDLDPDARGCILVNRSSADDPSVAPAGEELWCGQVGISADDDAAEATARIERSMTSMDPSWRSRESWRETRVVTNASGAVDPPGTSWRDRPGVERGDGVFLCGDMTSAPGLLAEVAVNSAILGAALAVAEGRQRSFAPQWTGITLGAEQRIRLLAATLESPVVELSPDADWSFEPYQESEPGVVVRRLRDGTTMVFVRDGDSSRVWGLIGLERATRQTGHLSLTAQRTLRLTMQRRLRRHARRSLGVPASAGD